MAELRTQYPAAGGWANDHIFLFKKQKKYMYMFIYF